MLVEKDSQHFNLVELDAIIKGINLATLWKMITVHLFTDSACVHKWISDTLTGKARVITKAASEMFFRHDNKTGERIRAVNERVLGQV